MRTQRQFESGDIELSRRQAIVLGVAGAAGLVCGDAGSAEEADPYRGLKVGMHSYTLRKLSFEQALAVTRSAGVRYIGFKDVHVPMDSSREQLAEARLAIKEAGLTTMACGVVGFNTDAARARKVFEYAKAMGMPTVVANPEPESLDILDELVEEFGIRIAIHNHGPKSLYSTPDDLLEAIEGHHEQIGACVDIGHYERSDIRGADALMALRDRFYDMHLKDVDRAAEGGKSVLLGEGVVDLESVFSVLLKLKPTCHIALEYERASDELALDVKKCYAHVRSILA